MATNQERRETTRANIVSAARECFTRDGYENTHTDNILESAGVSRGAMYHHFRSKREVFEAVYTTLVEDSIAHALQAGANKASATSDSPIEELITSCYAWLRLVRRPDVAAILIEQGPQVLGWKTARDIEAKSSLSPMQNALARACAAGELQVASIEVTARLINAILSELALISVYKKPKVPITQQEACVRQFIEGLKK